MSAIVLHALRSLTAQGLDSVERDMLATTQVECPVYHHFGPGVYVREVHMPGGTLALGHRQLQPHLNILLKGEVLLYNAELDNLTRLQAPFMYVGGPGRKLGYITQDMVWQNIYATTERDVRRLEEMFIDKSATFAEVRAAHVLVSAAAARADQENYRGRLERSGLTEEYVQRIVQNMEDQVDMPQGSWPVRVDTSPIHGYGIFCTAPVAAGAVVAPARVRGKRTPVGRYTNHSASPNCRMSMLPNGDVLLVALRNLRGSAGGLPGEEATIDYWQALREIGAFA